MLAQIHSHRRLKLEVLKMQCLIHCHRDLYVDYLAKSICQAILRLGRIVSGVMIVRHVLKISPSWKGLGRGDGDDCALSTPFFPGYVLISVIQWIKKAGENVKSILSLFLSKNTKRMKMKLKEQEDIFNIIFLNFHFFITSIWYGITMQNLIQADVTFTTVSFGETKNALSLCLL